MLVMKNGKSEAMGGTEQPTKESIRRLGEKGKLEVFGNIGNGHHQTGGVKGK